MRNRAKLSRARQARRRRSVTFGEIVIKIVSVLAMIIFAPLIIALAVLYWFFGRGEEAGKEVQGEQGKKEEPKSWEKEPWQFLSEDEIKEYLKKEGLRVDPTRHGPAKKAYGLPSSFLLPGADFIWKGVCPHCGWGISAFHVIGSFRAIAKCKHCEKFALLDREAERFLAIVPQKIEELGDDAQNPVEARRNVPTRRNALKKMGSKDRRTRRPLSR